jgi:hypothetical protein
MLGLIWNVRDETVPWVAALSAITNEIENDAPRFQTGAWRRLFPAKGFLAVEERHAAHSHIGTSERVIVQRTLSVSYIAALSADQRAAVERRVRALIEATPELTGSSETAFPYRTSMFAYRKIQA